MNPFLALFRPKDWSAAARPVLYDALIREFQSLPGFGSRTVIRALDGPIAYGSLSKEDMLDLYAGLPRAKSYIKNRRDCENFAFRAAVELADLWVDRTWSDDAAPPLAQGVIWGILPIEGTGRVGAHALAWCRTKSAEFWLYSYPRRELLPRERLREIQRIDEIEMF